MKGRSPSLARSSLVVIGRREENPESRVVLSVEQIRLGCKCLTSGLPLYPVISPSFRGGRGRQYLVLSDTMGIQGLLPLLKDVSSPVHVRNYAGKTLGIDAYVWLHRGAYACSREIAMGENTTRYVAYALSRIRMLQHFGVTPYLVFDGDKLPAKQHTEDDRELRRYENLQRAKMLEREGKAQEARELFCKCVDITPEMAFQLIKVLQQETISYVVAPYEADAQLAFLEANSIIDGIITEDSDLLVFGCKTVLFKLDQAGNCIEILQSRFWTNKQLAFSGWTPIEFRQMAILSGCDYLPSIVGMGLKNAHRFLRRYKTIDKVLQAVRLEGKMRVPQTYSREFRKAELTFVHQRVYDPRTNSLVTLTPLPDGTADEMLPFIGAPIANDVARGIAQGSIDPITRQAMVDRCPKPLTLRSSSAQNISPSLSRPNTGMHRSTTAPGGLYAESSSSSFYRNGTGVASAKKKVVSKEAGLQSLKSFFGSATPKTSVAQTGNGNRNPLSERDMNRPSQQVTEVKGKARQVDDDHASEPATPALSATKSRFFGTTDTPMTPSSRDKTAYLGLGGQLTPTKPVVDPNDSGYWEDCQDLQTLIDSSPLRRASQFAMHEARTPSKNFTAVRARVGSHEDGCVPSSPDSGFISSPTSSVKGCVGSTLYSKEDSEPPSSPLLSCHRVSPPVVPSVMPMLNTDPIEPDTEESQECEPAPPLIRSCSSTSSTTRKPALVFRSRTDSSDSEGGIDLNPITPSSSKLDAFRYGAKTSTPHLLRRATDSTTPLAKRSAAEMHDTGDNTLTKRPKVDTAKSSTSIFDAFRYKIHHNS